MEGGGRFMYTRGMGGREEEVWKSDREKDKKRVRKGEGFSFLSFAHLTKILDLKKSFFEFCFPNQKKIIIILLLLLE